MSSVDEAAVRAAVKEHKDHILENVETMTLKSCRRTLEQDMGLESGALKPFKMLLSALIDKLLQKHKAAEAAAEAAAAEAAAAAHKEPPASGKGKKRQSKKKEAAPPVDDSEGEEEAGSEEEEEAPRKRQPKKEGKPAKQSGPRQYSARVEKMRGICKAATITIPPSLYSRNKGSEEALQQALEELLEKHGLDASAGEREISRARARLQQQRDLDGIETSNIIEGGRRRRAAAAPVSYKTMVDLPSESEEEEEEQQESSGSEGEEEEAEASEGAAGNSGSEGEHEAPASGGQRGKKEQGRKKAPAQSESEAGSSSGEEEEEEAAEEICGKKAAAATKAQQAKSPDENAAAHGNGSSAGKAKQPPPSSGKKTKPKARPASSMEDSEGEQPVVQASKRRVMADWSDDE